MYEVIKDMGAVVIIAVNCLCSVFVVKCMKEITKATIDKINYSNFAHRFCLYTLKIQYLAVIQLSKVCCYAA